MRYTYGSDGGDVVTDTAGNILTARSGTVWTARSGGSQVTDILTLTGTPTGGNVVTDSRGRLAFQGPDDTTATLWWDTGGGVRWAVQPTETDRIARTQVEKYGVLASTVGEPDGVAGLDSNGLVPQDQLPNLSASYVPYPAGGQSGDTLMRGAGQAVYWGRSSAGTVSPWAALEAQAGPRWFAHRGGANLFPENTLEAVRGAVALGTDAVEIDVYRTSTDAGLFVMHDTTMDRTSNLAGSTAGLTIPAALRGRIDAGSWFANTWPSDLRIPLFSDVLADVGNTVPLIVHCNNSQSGNAAVAEILRQELEQAVCIMAWGESGLIAARAAGIPNVLLDSDGILTGGLTYASLLASGTGYLGVDYSQTTNATIQAAHAAGLKVMVFTVNRRADFAALPTDGSVWAVISDDPWYVKGTSALRSTDLFAAGTFYHGMPGLADTGDYRGFFQLGSPNWWGLDAVTAGPPDTSNGGFAGVGHHYLGPLPNTFTLDFDYVLDAVDYASASLQVMLGVGDRQYDDQGGGAANPNGYNILVRSNGTIDVYRITNGTPTSIGTVATAAIGLGTTQHLRVQVTATQIIVTRTNIAAPNSVTITNSTYRGGMYPNFGVRDTKARWANVAVT
ncbi:glycerophosphodiester phosphodiesterase family protein [Streptomyces sp. CS081A]|uniref:glycerophosphodiester phosphodiesterase n=1 Tax=Streptomyces sp. CS081A TaxID=2162709 RepID=UPI0013A5705C|nr:glycerophosphodiester phosphodiesterase family protein [Streptomyces sp. CS081A]